MSAVLDLTKIEERCREQGVGIADVLAWAVRAAFGIDVRLLAPEATATIDAQSLEELKAMFEQLNAALVALNAEVAKDRDALASVRTYVAGIPELVAQAVSTALANAGADEATAVDQINAARDAMAASVNDTLAAVTANTPAPAIQPVPDAPPATDPAPAPATDPAPAGDAAATDASSAAPATDGQVTGS